MLDSYCKESVREIRIPVSTQKTYMNSLRTNATSKSDSLLFVESVGANNWNLFHRQASISSILESIRLKLLSPAVFSIGIVIHSIDCCLFTLPGFFLRFELLD